MTRRAVELATMLVALGLAATPRAVAQAAAEPTNEPTLRLEASPAPATAPAFKLEVGGGFGSPLGTGFVDIVYTPSRWLSLGVGAGFLQPEAGIAAYIGKIVPRYGAFARGTLLRRSGLALGPVLTFSTGDIAVGETYMRPQYAPEKVAWSWRPGYRLDAGVGLDVAWRRLSARLEVGVGYVLNRPTCDYSTDVTGFEGSCDAPEIPAYYHFDREPGRVTPYVSLAVGAASVEPEVAPDVPGQPGARARADDPRVDNAWAAPTALTQPKGRVAVTLYELFMPNLTVGVTDRVQVSAGAGWFFFSSGPVAWDASIKVAVARFSHLHVALMAGTIGVRASDYSSMYGVGAGPVVSLCVDEGCESVLSTAVLGGNVHSDPDEGSPYNHAGVLVSPSAVLALVHHVKLVAEAHFPPGNGELVWVAALRVPFGPVAVDGGVLQGKLPVASITWRW